MNETETLRRIAEAVHGYDATECMADHQRRLSDVVAALADVPSIPDYHVLVWMPSGTPIVPFDCNPTHEDDGMLLYTSRAAAVESARHQQAMYGDDETATPVPLAQVGIIRLHIE
jgi:hypothetical protein